MFRFGWVSPIMGRAYVWPSGSFLKKKKINREKNRVPKDEDEEEGMSMVSDASSASQIFHVNEYYSNAVNGFLAHAAIDATLLKNSVRKKKNKNRGSRSRKVEEVKTDLSFLDDTTSSPFFNFT